MICNKCGHNAEEDASFCPMCGSRMAPAEFRPKILIYLMKEIEGGDAVGETVPVESAAQTHAPETMSKPAEELPAQTESLRPAYTKDARFDPTETRQMPNADLYMVGSKHAKKVGEQEHEKLFFGEKAFILCLIVITILAGAAGAFAYMYFSLLSMLM